MSHKYLSKSKSVRVFLKIFKKVLMHKNYVLAQFASIVCHSNSEKAIFGILDIYAKIKIG